MRLRLWPGTGSAKVLVGVFKEEDGPFCARDIRDFTTVVYADVNVGGCDENVEFNQAVNWARSPGMYSVVLPLKCAGEGLQITVLVGLPLIPTINKKHGGIKVTAGVHKPTKTEVSATNSAGKLKAGTALDARLRFMDADGNPNPC